MSHFHCLGRRRPPAIKPDDESGQQQNCAKEEWEESGTGRREIAKAEAQGLPGDERAAEAEHACNNGIANAIAQCARKPALAESEKIDHASLCRIRSSARGWVCYFLRPSSAMSCASFSSSLAIN